MYTRHERHFDQVKAFLGRDPFHYSSYDVTEAELTEIFTSPRLKEAAPAFFPADFKQLQMLGDAALDLHILTLLRERNFAGSFEDEKKRLVGNGADQPLNQLFDRLGLQAFVLGFEDPLSPHQKADVVEALFGFLQLKGQLKPELIVKLFEAFLPKPVPRPAAPRALSEREALPSAADLIAKDPCFLDALIKTRPDHILSLSQALIEEILRVMIEKPQSESGPLVKRLNALISFNGSIRDSFFRAALHQDAFSPEKFNALFPKARPEEIRLGSPMESGSPTLLLKLAHYAMTDESRMDAALHCLQRLQNPREKPEGFVPVLHQVTQDLQGFEFLIPEFEKLTPERQALFPKLNEAVQLWQPHKANPSKLLNLEVSDFEKVISAFGVRSVLANTLRAEIERRLGDPRVTEKTRKSYQPYIACLTPGEVAASASGDVKPAVPRTALTVSRLGGGSAGDRVELTSGGK